jgi:hypothetical protein
MNKKSRTDIKKGKTYREQMKLQSSKKSGGDNSKKKLQKEE